MDNLPIVIEDLAAEGPELSDDQLLAVRGGLMASGGVRSTCVSFPPTGAFDED